MTIRASATPGPIGTPSRPVRSAVVALLVLAALAFSFRRALLTYAGDTFYQSHFLFLWLLFAIALVRSSRARIATRLDLGDRRQRAGLAVAAVSFLLFCVSARTGSSTVERVSLVLAFAAFALLSLRTWSAWRCFGYAAFALLCFGVPYSVYHPLTKHFRDSFVALLRVWPEVTGQSFHVVGYSVVFPEFSIAITEDCSGLNQVVFFLALAFLGSLSGRTTAGRTLLLFGSGLVLAYLSNLVRVLVFIALAEKSRLHLFQPGWRHELIGLAAYAPFILAFIWLILRTHRPRAPMPDPPPERGRFPLAWLVVPWLAVATVAAFEPARKAPDAAAWIAEAERIPGWSIAERARSEDYERGAYATSRLVNVSLVADDGSGASLQIFSYVTSSTNQLAVHQVKNCLERPDNTVRYGPTVEVDGRRFSTIEVADAEYTLHGYFAFTIDGEDRDDSLATSIGVLWRRLVGRAREVEFMRILFPGPLPAELPELERKVLAWRTESLRRREEHAR